MRYDETTLAFWILTIATFCGFFFIAATEDAEADGPVGDHTSVEIGADEDEYTFFGNYYPRGPLSRQMNGTLWYFHVDVAVYGSASSIVGSFSTNNGITWSNITLIDETDPGFSVGGYPWEAADWCILSNNSIIVLVILKAYSTATRREAWLFCHWNNTDLSQWERILVYAHASYDLDLDSHHVVVNGDDEVMVAYTYRINRMDYEVWDFTDRTHTNDLWYIFTCRNYGWWLMCNTTGSWLVVTTNGASPEWWTLYEIDSGTETSLHTAGTSSSYYVRDALVTTDDTVIVVNAHANGGSARFHYYNETDDGARYFQATPYTDGTYPKLSITNDSVSTLYISAYHTTTDRYIVSGNPYYRDSDFWRASKTEFWDETTDNIKSKVQTGSTDLYPALEVGGETINTQLPDTGYMWVIADYDSADDRDWHAVRSNGLTWPAIPWYFGPAPNIATVALDDGTYGTWYEFTVTGEGGETPYIWSLLIGPAWLNIGASNGTLYGEPSGVASWSVTVRLTETHDAPRSDDETWTLKINSASSGADEPVSSTFIFDDVGEMWVLLAFTAVFVALARTWKMATYRRDQG